MFNFDLQLFDEEVNETSAVEENSAENTTESAELPEDFEGLEEYKEEILQEVAEMKNEETEETTPVQKIPYERFKQKVDEVNALKAQIDELKKSAEKPPPKENNSPPPSESRQISQPQPPPPIPQLQVTPELMNAMQAATNNLALQMSGLTEQQVKELEYAEEDDADLIRWRYAQQLAANEVQTQVRNIRQAQQIKAQQFMTEHNAAIESYNAYAAREMQEKNFEEVKNFATGEYFDALPPNVQRIIAESYVRIERQTASPAEIILVQNYFAQAKAAFYSRKSQAKPKKNNALNLPKADLIQGANSNISQNLSARDIEKLLDETADFDNLDPRIKQLFEN